MAAQGGRRKRKLTCDECFFRCRGLCALEVSEPCTTFRPAGPQGLVPPTQLMLMERQTPPMRNGGLLDLLATA